jgi:hypothetical protein
MRADWLCGTNYFCGARPWQGRDLRLQRRRLGLQEQPALRAAEKVNSKRRLVAQAILPVLVLLHLSSMHSQEWLCYLTFSARCLAAEAPETLSPQKLLRGMA